MQCWLAGGFDSKHRIRSVCGTKGILRRTSNNLAQQAMLHAHTLSFMDTKV